MRWLRRALTALCGAVLAVVGACAPDLPTAPAAPGVLRKLVVPTPGFTQVSAGQNDVCALKSDGSIVCWGDDEYGRTAPPAGAGYTRVSAGGGHACALTSDGTLACWGYPYNGATSPPAGAGYTEVSAGANHSCAIRADGTLACWGVVGTPPTGTGYTHLSAGQNYSCALKSDGSIACWGDNRVGQASPPAGTGYRQVSTGPTGACAVKSDGTLTCWGYFMGATPPSDAGYAQVGAGGYHGCALRTDGSLTCWGNDNYGRASPPAGTDYTQLSVDASYNCALKRDGSIACWGYTPTGSSTPWATRVAPAATFVAPPSVIVGQSFTLALQGAHVPGGYASTFTYALDCGTGAYAAAQTAASASCTAPAAAGPVTVRGKVIDQDQDATEYSATVAVLTPAQATGQLRRAVAASGIAVAVRQGLTDKLDAALAALGAGQTGAACNQLAAFQSQVQAQRGKAIPAATADAWLAQAAQIRRAVGC